MREKCLYQDTIGSEAEQSDGMQRSAESKGKSVAHKGQK